MKKFSKIMDVVLTVSLAATVILNIIAGTFYDALSWFVALLLAIVYVMTDGQLAAMLDVKDDLLAKSGEVILLAEDVARMNADLRKENEELKRKIEEMENK